MVIQGLAHATARGLQAFALAMVLVPALQASPRASLNAAGTMPQTASVELPVSLTSLPSVLDRDMKGMRVSVHQPLILRANVPSKVALSPLELEVPSGVDRATVGATVDLMSQDNVLVGASTDGGGISNLPRGAQRASVSARFYTTNNQTLPAGLYRASTLVSVYAD